MSWTEIRAEPLSRNVLPGDVTMSCPADQPRRRRFVSISIRTAKLPGLIFFQAEARVRLLLGDGEFAGKLRLLPNGTNRVQMSGGPKTQCPVLKIPVWAGVQPGRWNRTDVEFDYGGEGDGEWGEITLPGWAQPALPLVAPPQPPVPVTKPPGASFKGHLASQPHVVLGDRRLAP